MAANLSELEVRPGDTPTLREVLDTSGSQVFSLSSTTDPFIASQLELFERGASGEEQSHLVRLNDGLLAHVTFDVRLHRERVRTSGAGRAIVIGGDELFRTGAFGSTKPMLSA